jgi:hypothetical protein
MRGERMFPISPDLSKQDRAKIHISMRTTGGITPDATGAETYGTVTALAESPIRPGLLYAGTDDGNVWLTRNDGSTWENLTGRFPGLPAYAWTRRIEPSSFDSSTFYVAFSNHQVNDFAPYLYVTTDYGRTFRSIANDLPRGGPDFVHVIREDPYNRDLLFVGTDVGVYVSMNRGQSWQKFMTGLPTVPVHDLKIHPRDRELIAGTHGRSIWIVDIAPLEQMADSVLRSTVATLFAPKTAFQYGQQPMLGEATGHKIFQAPSPQYGAEIAYRLPTAAQGPVRIVITDVKGDTLRTLTGPAAAGIHRVYWDFRGRATRTPLSPAALRDSIVTARRVERVVDSLVAAGTDRALIDRLRTQLAGGGFGGGGGGGGGAPAAGPQRFNPRPGESPPPTPGRRGGAVAAVAEAGGESQGEGEMGDDMRSALQAALRGPGGRGGGGGFGGAQAPLVSTGDYLVTMTVGGRTMKQVLHVERVGALASPTIASEEELDEGREP